MSKIVDTEFGRFRAVTDGQKKWFLWECPVCKEWGGLSEEQWDGKVSVNHGADHPGCTYHETHEFGKFLVSTMQAMILSGYRPYHDEDESRWQPSKAGGVDGVI